VASDAAVGERDSANEGGTMTYLQFLLVIHVLGALVGFGSTFAFAFFPDNTEGRVEPPVRTALADISYKVTSRFTIPVAFFLQPITGALMIYETRRSQDFFSHTWLWIAIGLYLIAIGIVAFIAFPDTRHEYESTREGHTPDPTYRRRGNPNVYGSILGVLIVVIAILMVWKPGD
jgi:hypothetical protein